MHDKANYPLQTVIGYRVFLPGRFPTHMFQLE
jgi:hypothetical protein